VSSAVSKLGCQPSADIPPRRHRRARVFRSAQDLRAMPIIDLKALFASGAQMAFMAESRGDPT
jgi:hypothetical protein